MIAIAVILFGGLVFGLWLLLEFVRWRFADEIKQHGMSKEADRIYKEQRKNLILYDLEKEKAILAQKVLAAKHFPKSKPYKTELLASNSKNSRFEWSVKHRGVVDVDFEEVGDNGVCLDK